jgi:hypothetical protein
VDLAGVLGQVVAGDPLGLPAFLVPLLAADAHGHVGPLGHFEHLGEDLRPIERVAVVGNDQLQVEFRRLQQQAEGPGVVDVVADVGVEDHGGLVNRLGRLRGRRGGAKEEGRGEANGEQRLHGKAPFRGLHGPV